MPHLLVAHQKAVGEAVATPLRVVAPTLRWVQTDTALTVVGTVPDTAAGTAPRIVFDTLAGIAVDIASRTLAVHRVA